MPARILKYVGWITLAMLPVAASVQTYRAAADSFATSATSTTAVSGGIPSGLTIPVGISAGLSR
jgi:hypothetical protein